MRITRAFVIAAVVLGVADSAAAQITFTTLAGIASVGSDDGTGGAARFSDPVSVAVDSVAGNVYVADFLNHTIRRTSSSRPPRRLASSRGRESV